MLADGHDVQFWADVALAHPGILSSFPGESCTPIAWNYDAPDVENPTLPPEVATILATIGVDMNAPTDFATIVAPLASSDHGFWVAPGTSTWQSLVGRWPNARANLVDAAVAGRRSGATGYLVTDWGDSGHLQPPVVSLPPMAYGGAVAWCAATNDDLDVASVVDVHLVDDPARRLGALLLDVGSLAGGTGVIARNASPLFQAVAPSPTVLTSGEPNADALRAALRTLERARDDLGATAPRSADGDRLVDELDVAAGLARHGARRLLARCDGAELTGAEPAGELAELIDRHRSAWLASSRPGGLDDSVAALERTLAHERRG